MRLLLLVGLIMCFAITLMAQEIPVPQGLEGKVVQEADQRFIELTWQPKASDDAQTVGFNVLVQFPNSDKLLIYQRAGLLYGNSYRFPIYDRIGTTYRFALMGVRNFPELQRSAQSPPVEVQVPSIKLPNIEISNAAYQNGSIRLTWQYNYDIPDLAGYQIYLNSKPLAVAPKDAQNWSKAMTDTGKYIFEIAAITENKVESRKSQKRLVKID